MTHAAPTTHSTDHQPIHDVIIIGSGPAGYTAALYAARAGLRPLVIEGPSRGGALMTTTEVENFPGFPTGIAGPELMELLRSQAERFEAVFVTDQVVSVDLTPAIKQIRTGTAHYRSRTVILAMGSEYRRLGLADESRLSGAGVSWCATCDGFFFRDADIGVVGGGDTAMEEATFLTRFARSVTVIHRRDTFRASEVMLQRARSNPKINWVLDARVESITGDDRVEGVVLRDLRTDTVRTQALGGLFVAIGHTPRSALVADQVDLDDDGFIRTYDGTTSTGINGVFAAGDVVDSRYRQAITAAGTGCSAAIDAERYLAALP
nr:thioredoxin-disulfide reductase [Gordonia sp. LAM0048]